ncbi:MAG: hypothetical protein ABSE73_21000 [Planctomycetota bacterium]
MACRNRHGGHTSHGRLGRIADGHRGYSGQHIRFYYYSIVARRRPVFTMRLFVNCLATADVDALEQLQLGTFGYPAGRETYVAALKRFKPDFILWRKTAPVPRGYGKFLKQMSRTVYQDELCEIWQLRH